MTLCYSRERAEKFSTRDRWCINHFVRTVNGERVVSQIQNDFTVSPSLSMCFHRTMAARATLQRLNFDRLKTTIVYGNFVIIRYIVIILVDLKDRNSKGARRKIDKKGKRKRQRMRSRLKKQKGIRQWSERSRTESSRSLGGECVWRRSVLCFREKLDGHRRRN